MQRIPPPTRVIYALLDPEDGNTGYVGYIIPPRSRSLEEAIRRGKMPPAVDAWHSELAEVGERPRVQILQEGVAAGSVRGSLREELARHRDQGIRLLNDLVPPHLALRRRMKKEKDRKQAWAQVAEALREHLGGPLHPPTGSTVALSDAAWARIEHLPHPSVEQAADLPYERQEAARLAVVEAELAAFELADALIGELQTFWPDLTHMYGGNVGREVAAHVGSVAVGRRRDDRQYLGTLCALIPWCAISVAPWYQMATAGGLVHSVEQFVTWLGDHPAARALDLIAEEGFWLQGVLSHAGMAVGWNSATAMVATAVAHCAIEVPEALHGDIIRVLRGLMVAPGLTEPMADLLLRLDGNALQTLGPDVAPGIDERLSLPEGTTARVLPALVAQLGVSAGDALREMAWRSAKRPPTVATPDRSALSGLAGVNMRVVSTLLIEAGYLAPPPGLRPGVYEDITRSLLTACQATDLDEGM